MFQWLLFAHFGKKNWLLRWNFRSTQLSPLNVRFSHWPWALHGKNDTKSRWCPKVECPTLVNTQCCPDTISVLNTRGGRHYQIFVTNTRFSATLAGGSLYRYYLCFFEIAKPLCATPLPLPVPLTQSKTAKARRQPAGETADPLPS